ncbi:MAG: hypothetical protein GX061_09305 [Eubacteriaceae bacterium]|nr:hypothetical protein [Eubacteriaceae bacterium]
MATKRRLDKVNYIRIVISTIFLCVAVVLIYLGQSEKSVVIIDGADRHYLTLYGESSAADALYKAGITLNEADTLSVALDMPLAANSEIKIYREALTPQNIAGNTVAMGGEMTDKAQESFEKNIKAEAKRLLEKQRARGYTYKGMAAQSSTPLNSYIETKAGIYGVYEEKTIKATGYCACPICCGKYSNGYTADGSKATAGYTIAAPKTYPFGKLIYIPFFDRVFEVEDRGGAITEGRLDIYFNTHDEALRFGVKNLKIYVLK